MAQNTHPRGGSSERLPATAAAIVLTADDSGNISEVPMRRPSFTTSTKSLPDAAAENRRASVIEVQKRYSDRHISPYTFRKETYIFLLLWFLLFFLSPSLYLQERALAAAATACKQAQRGDCAIASGEQ